MLYITEDDVRRLLPIDACVGLMRDAFTALGKGTGLNQPRRRMLVPTGAVLHSMAGAFGSYFGTKFYSVHLKHGAHFFFMLFDAHTAQPLALMEANHLGQIRTGAASGYATDLLARQDSHTLGVIGSGFQARSQIEAVLQVRRLREVMVFSRNEARREAFAAECTKAFGVPVVATQTAEEAVCHADIVVTATFSKEPVIESSWVRRGTHVNAMGSNNAQRRELPSDLVRRADLIVVDSIEQSKIEAGDLLLAGWTESDWDGAPVLELKDADGVGRPPEAVTIFKSNGLGVEDVAAAAFVYERARDEGLNRKFYS